MSLKKVLGIQAISVDGDLIRSTGYTFSFLAIRYLRMQARIVNLMQKEVEFIAPELNVRLSICTCLC